MFKVKQILSDLIDQTYEGNEKLDAYKRFYVELINEERKSFHGDYHIKTHRIRIFNLYRDEAAIVATTIHEVAHHIDVVNRGTTDHSMYFYQEFFKVLYKALDMGLFSKDDFLKANRDASDCNKIANAIKTYHPKVQAYREGIKYICVYNCYEHKDFLKSRGYYWNKVDKSWEKEVDDEMLKEEIEIMEAFHMCYDTHEAKTILYK